MSDLIGQKTEFAGTNLVGEIVELTNVSDSPIQVKNPDGSIQIVAVGESTQTVVGAEVKNEG